MDPSDPETILYDDDEIRVIWSPGASEFVMITFGDLITPVIDLQFFADVPLKKSNIAAIGVMAKRGHWYPVDDVRKAAGPILERIAGYATRITYGGSMGGYAAIKFSALLGATHSIALCPQWSIDPAECQGADPGWENHFVPAMRGMGIRPTDVAGEVYLFADAFDVRDMFHCRAIMENYPRAHLVNVPAVGHHVTTVFAGTGNLLHLIDACRAGDIAALRAFCRRTRRNHTIWRQRIVRHAMQKLPRLGVRLLNGTDDRDLLRENWRYFPHILGHLAATAGAARALAFHEAYWTLLPGLVEHHLICAYLVGLTGGRVGVATAHASWLIYTLSDNRVLNKHPPFDPWEIPIEAERLGAAATLFVTIGGTKFLLSVNDDGWLEVPAIQGQGEEGFLFEFAPGENGRFTISHGGHYLSAEAAGAKPAGRVICDRDSPQAWEMFRFGPLLAAAPDRIREGS